jgi:orotate phosphoribosyltransferase
MKKSTIYNPGIARALAKMLLETGAVDIRPKSNPFTWSSGIQSPIYCDNRKLLSYSQVRNFINFHIKNHLMELREHLTIAGVATGAIAWGAMAADRLSLPFIYVRAESKKHGQKNLIEGVLDKRTPVYLIEDLISTGGSSLKAVEAIRDAGGTCNHMIALFTYGFPEAETVFTEAGVELVTLCDFKTLLPIAVEMGKITAEELVEIQEFTNNPKGWLPNKEPTEF